MMECALVEIGDKQHFATKRFDRLPEGKRVHVQTLCAMAGLDYNLLGTHDYIQLFQTAEKLNLGDSAMDQVFLRMAFNVCMANNDDHSKNHSFLLKKNENWALAPAYDLMHASSLNNTWLARHAMGVNGKYAEITGADILAVGARTRVRNPKRLLEKVIAVADSWNEFAKQANLPAQEVDRVGADISKCTHRLR